MTRKSYILAFLLMFTLGMNAQRIVTHYAKVSQNTTLNLHWTSANYGTIQWQQSTDEGATWSDIEGATSPAYTFKAGSSGEGWFRVVVNGDEACEPYMETHVVEYITFKNVIKETGFNFAKVAVTKLGVPKADIVEYGYCANYKVFERDCTRMPKTVLGTSVAEGDTVMVDCKGLLPAKTYSLRVYFKTADGSTIYGTNLVVNTKAGIEWDTEDWTIMKNRVLARFKVSGSITTVSDIKFEMGPSADNLTTYTTSVVDESAHKYTSRLVSGLTAGTGYLARVTANVDGEEQTIEKMVYTKPDYSSIEVDATVKPVSHRIVWKNASTPIKLNPDNIQAEYPRVLRVSADTLLLTYHGGDGTSAGIDHWQDVYMMRSFDNGATWTEAEKLMDHTKTWTHNWWRMCNPEMVKLKNGWILMTFSGNGNPETNENCEVLVMISKDGGNSWGDPITVMRGRTWEPMIVQLPNGDLELLVSSEAAWWRTENQGPQEIRSARSTDNGLTWTGSVRASYNPGRRDGMPVAVSLQGNKGVLFSIECPGSTTPSLLYRDLNSEWETGEWDGVTDNRRWTTSVLTGGCAPHIIQLTTGEIVMAAHLNQNGSVWQTCRSRVAIGDSSGNNFRYRTAPFDYLPTGQGAYYSSLFQKDDETIWLVISHSTYDGETCTGNAVEYIEGTIEER